MMLAPSTRRSAMKAHHETPTRRKNPKNGWVWIARYTTPTGQRLSAGTFKLKRDAQDAIDAAYSRPATIETVGAYAATWTERHPRSKRTNQTNDHRIGRLLDVPLDGRELRYWLLADLRRRHANDLVAHMLTVQARSPSGAVDILRAFSAMCEDAITDELAVGNPFKGVKVRSNDPRAVKESRKPRVWTWEQMHQLAAHAGPNEPMIRTLSDCGLRVGELFALRRTAVTAGVLSVAGSAWEGQITGSSHQKNHDRTIPIPPSLQMLLRQMPVRIDSDLLFPTPTGRVWRYDNWRRDVWTPARKASGIDAAPHEFRHSYISHLRAAGVDPADLAAIAGHSVMTASARYVHALHRSHDAVRTAIG
jgi:integrase